MPNSRIDIVQLDLQSQRVACLLMSLETAAIGEPFVAESRLHIRTAGPDATQAPSAPADLNENLVPYQQQVWVRFGLFGLRDGDCQ